ncbi:MAG: LysR family transcriptional regulator [Defluviimonas sp.]|uniref:LysR family transcriptional regulator n=1 Tax=Albidovulum sp. TaxID=1872424 RepID=UPI002A27EC74|nr:LysR family transcriptional regulator [Defluviimonas sp.]
MLYMTLRQMEYVVAVARGRSLSEAAVQLNVSQPSLSNALTQVEARLGHRLFRRRKGTATTLTPEGEVFVGEAEALLARARRLEDPARYARARTGRLGLGLFDDLAPFHLGPLLDALARALPDVEVHYSVADFEVLARDLLDGRIDMAVSYDLGLDASFRRDELARVPPQALLAPDDPLAGQARVTLAELADRPLILFNEGLSVRHMLGLFRQVGARPRVAHRVRSLEVMRSLAAGGVGTGISYSAPDTAQTYDGRRVVSVPISDGFAAEPIVLVRPAEARPDDRSRAAAEAIAACIRGNGPPGGVAAARPGDGART